MQGINAQKKLIGGIIFGVFLKIVLNFLFVRYLEEVGPILATYLGFIVSILYNFYIIKKTIQFKIIPLLQPIKAVFLLVFAMSITVWGVQFLTELWLPEGFGLYASACVISILSIITAVLFYVGIGMRLTFVKRFILKNKESSS